MGNKYQDTPYDVRLKGVADVCKAAIAATRKARGSAEGLYRDHANRETVLVLDFLAVAEEAIGNAREVIEEARQAQHEAEYDAQDTQQEIVFQESDHERRDTVPLEAHEVPKGRE